MSLIRWEPFKEIDRFFDDDFMPMRHMGWDLATDVYEEGNNIIVTMAVPGVQGDKIDVDVEGQYLRVSGSRDEEKESKDKNYYHKEIRRGSFERTIKLPAPVQGDQAAAEYGKDGVLKVTIPKQDANKGKIKVQVK